MVLGHEPLDYAEVMKKVNGIVDDNGDRPGVMGYLALAKTTATLR